MSLSMLVFALRSRDVTGLARPLLAAPHTFGGLEKPGYSSLTNKR